MTDPTTDAILDAARASVAQFGIRRTTLSDVARLAGVSRMTVYRRYPDLPALIRAAGDGLYVTDVAGLHSGVNPISGTFSVGASGQLIEAGELGQPVREITIASDLVAMLRSVTAIGSAARWVPFGGSVMAAPLLLLSLIHI